METLPGWLVEDFEGQSQRKKKWGRKPCRAEGSIPSLVWGFNAKKAS